MQCRKCGCEHFLDITEKPAGDGKVVVTGYCRNCGRRETERREGKDASNE